MSEAIAISPPPLFIDRPLFSPEEAINIVNTIRVTPFQGKELVSSREILDAVATALRETFYEIGYDEFEEVTAYALG